MRIEYCKVCKSVLWDDESDTLILKDVPDSTFSFSENVVDLYIVSCKKCGCVQLAYNVPISKDYNVVYRSLNVSKNYREEKKLQYKNFIEEYDLYNKDILEVGCGDGQILDIWKELGIQVDGIEAGKENVEICKAKNHNVIFGDISNGVIGKQYDAIYSFYFLEHLSNPVNFCNELYHKLKPNGIGLIEVPNYDIIEQQNNWLEFTKDHRVYYRKETLLYLLLSCGFSILDVKENESNISLSIEFKKFEYSTSFSKIRNKRQKDIILFKNLIDSFDSDFSIYGAGHYSQLLLNQLYHLYKIEPKYIFDSNKQKCGNNINGVTIKHLDEMDDTIDSNNIIIICGIYNDEVFNILKNNTNKKWKRIEKWD